MIKHGGSPSDSSYPRPAVRSMGDFTVSGPNDH